MGTAKLKLADLKPGDVIALDSGFTCHPGGETIVHADDEGELFFACHDGAHYLSGQLDWDNNETLVGVSKLSQPPA